MKLSSPELDAAEEAQVTHECEITKKIRNALQDFIHLECTSYKVEEMVVAPVALAEALGQILAALDWSDGSPERGNHIVQYLHNIRAAANGYLNDHPLLAIIDKFKESTNVKG